MTHFNGNIWGAWSELDIGFLLVYDDFIFHSNSVLDFLFLQTEYKDISLWLFDQKHYHYRHVLNDGENVAF